ncbi:MAG: hypothetical protein LC127_13795, partial [Chitinophagales bacterium]|nr:hypothetical protein [Chitinophagales bacterium]
RELPRIGIRFFKDRILFSTDADKDLIKSYLDAHWEVEILAEGNLSSQSPKALLMSKELNVPVVYKRRGEYELDFTEGDPMMSYLKRKGKKYKKSQILKSVALENGFDLRKVAEVELELKKEVDLKLVRVETKFSYELRPGALPAASGSRAFCRELIAANKMWTLEEIQAMVGIGFRGKLPVGQHAVNDPFLYTGGFYTTPGGQRGLYDCCNRHCGN